MTSFIAFITGLLLTTAHAATPVDSLGVMIEPIVTQASIVRGAQRVPFLHVTLESTCGAPTNIDSLTVHHRGRGFASDIGGIYAMADGKRVSRPASFSARTKTAVIRLRGFTIPACGRRTITIMGDISPDAATGGEHSLTVLSKDDIATDAKNITLIAPSSAPSASIAPSQQGVLSVSYLSLPKRITYGTDRTVLRVKLESDSRSSHLIDAITFTNEGKARNADLKNLWIGSTRGERLSNIAPTMDGETVRITFEKPLVLAKNDSVILLLHADTLASRTRTIQFEIAEAADIEARAVSGRLPR